MPTCRKPQGPCTPRKPPAKPFCSFPPCGEMPNFKKPAGGAAIHKVFIFLHRENGTHVLGAGCLWPPPTPEENRSPPRTRQPCAGGRTSRSLLFPNMWSSFWWGERGLLDWSCLTQQQDEAAMRVPRAVGWGDDACLFSRVVGEGCGDGKSTMISQHFAQLGLSHSDRFAWQCRSQFGRHPSDRVAMAHSLPGIFIGAGFLPTAWSGLGHRERLGFPQKFEKYLKTPKKQWWFCA